MDTKRSTAQHALLCSCVALAGSLLPLSAFAQTPDALSDEAKAQREMAKRTAPVTSEGPASRSAYGPRLPTLELDANEAGTTATFSIGAGSTRLAPVKGNADFRSVRRHNFTFKASVPINKETNEGSPFSFGDLGNFEKVEAGFTSFTSVIGVAIDKENLKNRAIIKCAKIEANVSVEGASQLDQNIPNQEFIYVLMTYRPSLTRDVILNSDEGIASALDNSKFATLRSAATQKCVKDPKSDEELISHYLGAEFAERLNKSVFPDKKIKFWGISGSAGQNKFEYVDALSFAKKSENRTAYAASAYAGLIAPDYTWSMRAKYSYLRQYEAAKEGQVCRPSPTTPGTQDCLSGALGLPTRSKSSVASLEFRRRFDVDSAGGSLPFAIAPQVTFDFDKKEYGIDFPIYLTANKEGKLTGGVKFGYRSDTKDVGAGLFIGVPFQVPF